LNNLTTYSEIVISGNRTVRFYDRSTVYFGDYHHVRLEARCDLNPPENRETSAESLLIAETVRISAVYIRVLERMAVPSASVEEVRIALIEDFRKNSLPYLSNPDFSLKMISKNVPARSLLSRKYPASFG
jgi:hypothetical protein